MKFVLQSLTAICLALLFACLAPAYCQGQQSATQPAAWQTAVASDQAGTQAYTLPPDKLAKAIALNRIRNILDIVFGLWGIGVVWLLLATGGAARLEACARGVSRHRWLQGIVFFAAVLTLMSLGSLPLEIYGHHVSVAYGISIQGWGSWLDDEAKALGLTVLVATPVLLLFNWIVRRWPRRYWFGVWLVTLPLMVFAVAGEPLIEPLFNTYEPLAKSRPALVDKLETVVARTGTNIPPERMFLMKASEKSTGLNAYVTGLGATKRYVMWDTAADRFPDDEILFVFGHESGHYVLNHIPKMLGLSAIGTFFVFWACAAFAEWVARRFGSRWRLQDQDAGTPPLATRAGFVVLIFAITIAGFILEPVTNTMSRYVEHQADVYGQEAIHGLVPDPRKTAVNAFNALGEAWLEDPNPSPIVEFWEYNHPSVKNRANFAAHYDPWANGGHGEFFDK
jgi:STE24 endopeptidase